MSLQLHYAFDENTFRHTVNGHMMVLHCHHYMALTTKLAEEYRDLGGPRILREVAEDSIAPVLQSYAAEHKLTTSAEVLEVAREYYSAMGLGRLEVTGTETGGEVRLTRSHVDEGWVKKWGKHDRFINHFTCGYVAAMFSSAFRRPPRSYLVTETSSIVVGDPVSVLVVRPA